MCAEGICKSIVSVLKPLFEPSHRRILLSHQGQRRSTARVPNSHGFFAAIRDVTDFIFHVEKLMVRSIALNRDNF